jgi:hypothetical protein
MGRRQALCTKKNGEPIRILHIGHHFCIRNIKQMRALKAKGYTVDAFSNRVAYGVTDYDNLFIYCTKTQFKNTLALIKDWYDIIQVANEPDWMLVEAYKLGCKNLIHDCHDLDSVRLQAANLDEVKVFTRMADGIIYVSYPIKKFAEDLYGIKDVPSTVLYHFCNENHVTYDAEQDSIRHGIVYEGGANPPWQEANNPFIYRSLYRPMRELVEMGNELHMFIGNIDGFESYQDFGAYIYPPTHYDELMKKMVQFKWGALIFNNEKLDQPQTNFTTMNKAYEYIMCGLPILAVGAPEQARILKKYGVVLEFKKVADIGNVEQTCGHLYSELKANCDKARELLTMERHIYLVENLYNEVLKKNTRN